MDNRVKIVGDIIYVDGLDVIDTIKKICSENDSLYKENKKLKAIINQALETLKSVN